MNKNDLNSLFMEEYMSEQSVMRYTAANAGHGISYLLNHVYGRIYWETIQKYLKNLIGPGGIRILEYGCGGGMNLITLARQLQAKGIPIERVYGTDFSPVLVEAAGKEADKFLPRPLREKAGFFVARNETIMADFAREFNRPARDFAGTFHLVIGVNTSRYCHRLKLERTATEQLRDLLVPGGISIVIDMNDRFPFFRSKMAGKKLTDDPLEVYVPSLSEYARPFKEAGFEVLQESTFAWTPHSAGPLLCAGTRFFAPVLQTLFPKHGMRSLVIARKIDRPAP